MLTNYYTLFHIAAELQRECTGKKIAEMFTQHRGELVILFQGSPAAVIVGCEPSDNYLLLRHSFARARRNSVDLFSDTVGVAVEEIRMHPMDRQVHMRLRNSSEIIIQIFGSKSNVLLVNTTGQIAETFLAKEDTTYLPLSETLASKTDDRQTQEDRSITKMLKYRNPHMGPVLVREVLVRCGIDGNTLESALSISEHESVLAVVERLKRELLSVPIPRIYFDHDTAVRFSVISLQQYADLRMQSFDSVSEAIQTYRGLVFRERSYQQEKEALLKILMHEQDHLVRTLHKMSAETPAAGLAKEYERYGKLLTAHLHLLKKGETTALVEDVLAGTGEMIEVPVDPHLNPSKNAERYFEKAHRIQRTMEEQKARKDDLTRQHSGLIKLLEQLNDVTTPNDLLLFVEDHRKALEQLGFKKGTSGQVEKKELPPFRVFTVAGGFQVWAGKSGENNDLLSTRHTAKNDLWFHARGVGGSHVVLKMGTGKGEVSKQAIEQSAAIAAYYSKMKNSKLVPVTMCEGKYVRKPKGVPAGTVTVEREKTIFAEPKLPA
jgi:predicted ribosome quality control (RQC) complex YloA/Tae2 family protein